MSIFEVVCKKSCFSRKTMKNANLTCLVLRVGPTGTQNRNSRPSLNSFQRYESNGGLKIFKQASVRNHVFRGKLFLLNLNETLITWYPGFYFGNLAYP